MGIVCVWGAHMSEGVYIQKYTCESQRKTACVSPSCVVWDAIFYLARLVGPQASKNPLDLLKEH